MNIKERPGVAETNKRVKAEVLNQSLGIRLKKDDLSKEWYRGIPSSAILAGKRASLAIVDFGFSVQLPIHLAALKLFKGKYTGGR